jgi:hypothetical protein
MNNLLAQLVAELLEEVECRLFLALVIVANDGG